MRLTRFLNEEDSIKKALSIPEPEVGETYSDEEVKEYITVLKDALGSKGADGAMIKDIQDKLDKWENVDVETKPAGPVVPALDRLAAQPPEGEGPPPEGEGPPPEEEEEPPPEEDEKDKKKKKKKDKDEEE